MSCFPEMVGRQPLLKIQCRECGHSVTWRNAELIEKLGYGTGPVQAAEMLKCSACGVKGRVRFL